MFGTNAQYATGMYDAVLNVGALIVQTEWKCLGCLTGVIKKSMNKLVILDGRKI